MNPGKGRLKSPLDVHPLDPVDSELEASMRAHHMDLFVSGVDTTPSAPAKSHNTTLESDTRSNRCIAAGQGLLI